MVEWEDNPFVDAEGEDLTCDSMSFMATDAMEASVCDLFADEVDQALAGGWGHDMNNDGDNTDSGDKGSVQVVVQAEATDPNAGKVEMWRTGVVRASMDRFKTVWFDDDLDGKIRKSSSDSTPGMGGPNDLYDLAETTASDENKTANITVIWKSLVDRDHDPVMGDFGKADFDDQDTDTATDADKPDGKADNYASADDAKACTDDDGGDGCDAMWSEDYEVLFADGLFGCEATRMVTISCEWDADGELGRYRADDHGVSARRRLHCRLRAERGCGRGSRCRLHRRLRPVHRQVGVRR